MKKSIDFLYTSNAQVKFAIKSPIPFIITRHKVKYLGINLMKLIQHLWANYKSDKQNQRILHKFRDIPCSW